MKLSVSLSDGDVAFLDEYARAHGIPSRSGVLHEALALLQMRQLGADYAAAWDEWAADEDNAVWDETLGDGVTHVPHLDGDAPRDVDSQVE